MIFLCNKNLSFQPLTVVKATREDQGIYECKVEDHSGNVQVKKHFVPVRAQEEPFLRMYSDSYDQLTASEGSDDVIRFAVQIEAYPEAKIEWYEYTK